MDKLIVIVVALIVCIVFVALLYMSRFNRLLNVKNIINEATTKSKFNPTTFHIYDRSTKTICDRLIVIMPFEWYLWAINNQLYILNPEAGIKCNANSVSAIQVQKNQFIETCLQLNLNSILQHYQRGKTPYIVDYTIESDTFTILSAINLLAREYITFQVDPSNVTTDGLSSSSATAPEQHMLLNENSPSNITSKMNKFTIIAIEHLNNVNDQNNPNKRYLSKESVIKLSKNTKSNTSHAHSKLLSTYLKHVPKKTTTNATIKTNTDHTITNNNNTNNRTNNNSSSSIIIEELYD